MILQLQATLTCSRIISHSDPWSIPARRLSKEGSFVNLFCYTDVLDTAGRNGSRLVLEVFYVIIDIVDIIIQLSKVVKLKIESVYNFIC